MTFLDSAKFDSNEEDTTSVFAPSFGLKQTDKVPSKTVAARKGMYFIPACVITEAM